VQSIALDAISESASVDLTQVGAHAALRSGGFVANAAAIYGFGDVGVSRNLPGLVATAAYDVKLWGALGEAGYRLRYGNWRVVPKVGLDWIRQLINPDEVIGIHRCRNTRQMASEQFCRLSGTKRVRQG
jgi:uncharacterized protein with beta-barrel porin domain